MHVLVNCNVYIRSEDEPIEKDARCVCNIFHLYVLLIHYITIHLVVKFSSSSSVAGVVLLIVIISIEMKIIIVKGASTIRER